MIIRFHKGQYVDALVPTAVDIKLQAAPGDILWQIPTDINPSKTITEEHPVQAIDKVTGLPEVDEKGQPVYETTTDEQGNTVTVTQSVDVTYTLNQNPSIFTPDDIQNVLINPPTIIS